MSTAVSSTGSKTLEVSPRYRDQRKHLQPFWGNLHLHQQNHWCRLEQPHVARQDSVEVIESRGSICITWHCFAWSNLTKRRGDWGSSILAERCSCVWILPFIRGQIGQRGHSDTRSLQQLQRHLPNCRNDPGGGVEGVELWLSLEEVVPATTTKVGKLCLTEKEQLPHTFQSRYTLAFTHKETRSRMKYKL